MLRVGLTIVVPLILPTGVYMLWIAVLGGRREGAAGAWISVPWAWLAAAGAVLLAIVLLFVTVGFGTPQQGEYVAPRWQNGHIIPGHIEPTARQ
jgi:hypothetical protein